MVVSSNLVTVTQTSDIATASTHYLLQNLTRKYYSCCDGLTNLHAISSFCFDDCQLPVLKLALKGLNGLIFYYLASLSEDYGSIFT